MKYALQSPQSRFVGGQQKTILQVLIWHGYYNPPDCELDFLLDSTSYFGDIIQRLCLEIVVPETWFVCPVWWTVFWIPMRKCGTASHAKASAHSYV